MSEFPRDPFKFEMISTNWKKKSRGVDGETSDTATEESHSLALIDESFHILAYTENKEPFFAFKCLDDRLVCFDLALSFIVSLGRRWAGCGKERRDLTVGEWERR